MKRTRTQRGISVSQAVAAAVLSFSASAAFAVDGTWINASTAGGVYGDPANWAGGVVASGADALGSFDTLDLNGIVPVTIAADQTIGRLVFGDTDVATPGGYLFTGSQLIFAGAAPSITTNALAAGSVVQIDNVIGGTNGLTLGGPGALQLTANNTYTGNTTVTNANLTLGTGTLASLVSLGAAGTTVTLNGTNTFNNGTSGGDGGVNGIAQNIVANAGSVTTFNMGNRFRFGEAQTAAPRNITGTGELVFNVQSTLDPAVSGFTNILTANFNAFAGTVRVRGTQFTNADGNLQSPILALRINGGQFGAGLTAATLVLDDFAVLQARTNSGGNTINIGALSGTSNAAGFITAAAGAASTYSIGALNTNTSFAGLFTGTNNVVKVGTGTLTLTSPQEHIGFTQINGGTLALSGAANLATSPTVSIGNGATLNVSATSGTYGTAAGQTLTTPANAVANVVGDYGHAQGTISPGGLVNAARINFANNLSITGGALALQISANTTPGGTNDLLSVGGTATLGGNVALTLGVLGGVTSGQYTLIQSTGPLTGSAAGWTLDFGGRGTATLSQSANALLANIAVAPGVALTWRGDANTSWDVGQSGSPNFRTGSNSAERFFQGDAVRFDDTVVSPSLVGTAATVAINTSVAPSSLVVDNSAVNYTFFGVGQIAGGTSLVKRGTGTLTMGTPALPTTPVTPATTIANVYSGGTRIEGGTLDVLLSDNAIGSGPLTLAGGTFRSTKGNANYNFNNAVVVEGSGVMEINTGGATARQFVLNGAISGSGSLTIQTLEAAKGIDLFGEMSGLNGALAIGLGANVRYGATSGNTPAVAYTLNGSLGSTTNVAKINRLGSLSGTGTLRGHQSSGTGSTVEWEIGALDTSTTFSGTVVDGLQGTVVRPVLITKVGTGTLTLTGANTYAGNTTVRGGTLRLGPAAQGPVLGSATVAAPAGADIQRGKLVLDYAGGTSPAATVAALLDAGYDQTPRFSTGLLRSTTRVEGRILGWIDNAANSTVTVAYTLAGDSNLDFTVSFPDLVTLAQNYNGPAGKIYAQGDTNYDGLVNFTDLVSLAQNYNGTALSTTETSVVGGDFAGDFALAQSLVPEPSAISLVGAASAATLRRRRR